jgi:hypothetical protein
MSPKALGDSSKEATRKRTFVKKMSLQVFQNKAKASIGAVVRVNVFKCRTAR